MTTVNIYLTFNGNCFEAFTFYKSVLGGEFSYVGRFKEMPPEEGMPPLPKEMEDMIMHISLPVSKETRLMGSDTGGEWAPAYVAGNNFSVSINTDSKEEVDRLFNGLSAGGQVTMPLNMTFWGDYFGMFTDKFGINWMISYDTKQEN
ncbi:MAG: VOC family protein [Alphaproteobacteria bacterium]|nr:VOC family protein [Alphaproteobacteria bacterium]